MSPRITALLLITAPSAFSVSKAYSISFRLPAGSASMMDAKNPKRPG